MRCDTARVVDWAGRFAFPRAAGSEGERQAAAIAGDELARLGLRVERVELTASQLPSLAEPWLGWMGVAAWSTGLVLATRWGAHWPVRTALALGALLWLRLTVVEGFPLGWARIGRVTTTDIVARRNGQDDTPPLRVVFHTSLETFDPGHELVPRWLATPVIAALLAALVFCELTINRNPLGLPAWCRVGSGPFLLLLLWLTIGARVARLVARTRSPDIRDNRTGLALLLELARGWPRGTEHRIETRFVATGGRSLHQAGLHALVRAMGTEWPARPTLIIDWLAPGIGRSLAVLERGTDSLAAAAARDLWIPHRTIHRAPIRHEHWPLCRHGPSYISIVGDAVRETRAPVVALTIDPDALGRAAQLATEVALRWAKQTESFQEQPATQPPAGSK
jgi:hypothetical protein